jgi:hypothetical protein
VVAEQHGGRQPHQAAADDQDRDFLARHGATLAGTVGQAACAGRLQLEPASPRADDSRRVLGS